jgi:hypothetical protein
LVELALLITPVFSFFHIKGFHLKSKSYRVEFTKTIVGVDPSATTLQLHLKRLLILHGAHLPEITLEQDQYQIRDLVKVGGVWQGVFARLKVDGPNIVDSKSNERQIVTNAGDRFLDKCHFLYREAKDIFVWQSNRSTASLLKVQNYLSAVLKAVVQMPLIIDIAATKRMLDDNIHELEFSYAKRKNSPNGYTGWNQAAFDLMKSVNAGQGVFVLRANLKGHLSKAAKSLALSLLGQSGVKKVRVRLTDETNPIDLFSSTLKEEINVNLPGSYPDALEVFQALEAAYDRRRADIPMAIK